MTKVNRNNRNETKPGIILWHIFKFVIIIYWSQNTKRFH